MSRPTSAREGRVWDLKARHQVCELYFQCFAIADFALIGHLLLILSPQMGRS